MEPLILAFRVLMGLNRDTCRIQNDRINKPPKHRLFSLLLTVSFPSDWRVGWKGLGGQVYRCNEGNSITQTLIMRPNFAAFPRTAPVVRDYLTWLPGWDF